MEDVCSGSDTVCSFVQCTDPSGKAIPFTEHVGCEDPKRVNCKKDPRTKGNGSGGVSVRAGVVALVVPLILHVCWTHVAKSI
uniref:EB domain-containing protein n=1 Tax=Globodera pallida TaxID=36090 RepID=A0A183C6L8_GLOPA